MELISSEIDPVKKSLASWSIDSAPLSLETGSVVQAFEMSLASEAKSFDSEPAPFALERYIRANSLAKRLEDPIRQLESCEPSRCLERWGVCHRSVRHISLAGFAAVDL